MIIKDPFSEENGSFCYFAFFMGRRVLGSIAAQTITAKIPVRTVVGSIYELL